MKKVILEFNGYEAEVSNDLLNQDVFDIDFSGRMMVEFTHGVDGILKPSNAMNRGGSNCYSEVKDKDVKIKEL
jgi:hypothetical protein